MTRYLRISTWLCNCSHLISLYMRKILFPFYHCVCITAREQESKEGHFFWCRFRLLHHHHLPPLPQSRQSAKLFLQSSELGLPHPSTAGECAPPPPLVPGGRGTLACRRWGGGIPIPEGTYTVVLYLCVFCTSLPFLWQREAFSFCVSYSSGMGCHVEPTTTMKGGLLYY
jgi:hypothetical protein